VVFLRVVAFLPVDRARLVTFFAPALARVVAFLPVDRARLVTFFPFAVAFLAAAVGLPPDTTMMSTLRRTSLQISAVG